MCFVTKGVKGKLHPGNWTSVTMGSATAPQQGPSLCCLHSGKESQVQMKQTNKAFLGLKGGGWKFCFAEQQQHGCLSRSLPILGQPVGVQLLRQEQTNLYPFGLPSFSLITPILLAVGTLS